MERDERSIVDTLDTPGTLQWAEMIVNGKLRDKDTYEDIEKNVFGGKNLIDLSVSNGFDFKLPFDEEMSRSCTAAANHPERKSSAENGAEEKIRRLVIPSLLSAMIDPKGRQELESIINESDLSALKFIYAITDELEGNIGKLDEIKEALFPIKQVKADKSGVVISIE